MSTFMLREAAAAVLDRWDSPQWGWAKHGPTADLMHALRAALAQPATPDAQPVAQIERAGAVWLGANPHSLPIGTKLYAAAQAAQPAPQPLSDDRINLMFNDAEIGIYLAERERRRALEIYSFGVRDAEAAHGITAAPTTGE